MEITPVILCGGSGSRIWPLSRQNYPKQFLNLNGQETLLQQTLARLEAMPALQAPILVANHEQRFLVAEQLRQKDINDASIILESVGRNTAPAVALAALTALKKTEDTLLVVLPSDHLIINQVSFNDMIKHAITLASTGQLVTFGIPPTTPHTGYGYILKGAPIIEHSAYKVASFVEKPALDKAREYHSSGHYFWNSGMFVFSARTYLQELARFEPKLLKTVESALELGQTDNDFIRADAEIFATCTSLSIDNAVMECTDNAVVVVPKALGWSDIGSWTAIADLAVKDCDGNSISGDVILDEAKNSYLRSEHRLLAAVGVENLIIIETADAVLVAHKNKAQHVKKIVEKLSLYGRAEAINHRKVYRPWGSYEKIDAGPRFQVKRIVVNPGSSLSLQMHYHRAEHWIVVKGTARVTNGEQTILLSENQSTYIPLGTKHRLSNPGKYPLELIEVQSGGYLGEDDIVRFEDAYGRVTS